MTSSRRPDRSASPAGAPPRPDTAVGADPVAGCGEAGAGPQSRAGAGPGADTDASAPLTARPLRGRPGARLSGSCDLDTRHCLSSALGAVTAIPGPVVHLDLSAVLFLDTAAVAALVRAAAALNGQGRRLLLHDPPYSLRKVVEMFPDECAALEVAA
ncbi:STAS domain-containing protein [Streptomyces sp. H27-H1]|uniref:STAS domain-containing protein n=1 Tax=Streptomyces sp. H27-H1 TaxID=2996461 RepID=UPI00227109C3|nr:STAS domain-containing protein [Streptomyces sp. H27-H1]MCY0930099.1 STAS domain-containing protein [Streptomyces sp. H27-H1]